ncbi:MAG: hypothetical protein ACLSB9_11610 [Hydrogeniiclostridium mannosilyticum]
MNAGDLSFDLQDEIKIGRKALKGFMYCRYNGCDRQSGGFAASGTRVQSISNHNAGLRLQCGIDLGKAGGSGGAFLGGSDSFVSLSEELLPRRAWMCAGVVSDRRFHNGFNRLCRLQRERSLYCPGSTSAFRRRIFRKRFGRTATLYLLQELAFEFV